MDVHRDGRPPETPDTDSGTGSVVVRRRGLFRNISHRLRTAAHWSRARRAEHLTEPTIDLVVGDHELYVRTASETKRSTSRLNITPDQAMNPVTNNNTQPTGNLVQRQTSGVSQRSTDAVFADNRYILSHGKIHFWKNYNYGEVCVERSVYVVCATGGSRALRSSLTASPINYSFDSNSIDNNIAINVNIGDKSHLFFGDLAPIR